MNIQDLTDPELDALLISTDKAHEDAVMELRRRYVELRDGGPVEPPDKPPTIPGVPVDPDAPFEVTNTVQLDPGHDEYTQAQMLRPLMKRGTRIVVPPLFSVSRLRLGGGWLKTFADGSPIQDIEVISDRTGSMEGIEIHPTVAGIIRLRDLIVTPTSVDDKAALKCVGPCYEAHLDLAGCHMAAFPGSENFDGFGILWGIILHGASMKGRDLLFDAAEEWGVYGMNTRGMDIDGFSNLTREINGVEYGMGRGLVKHENRIDAPRQNGALGGMASTGLVRFANGTARRCGHEGMLRGDAPSGGSDFTIGGHTGEATRFESLRSIDPYCGGVAVWQEREEDEVTDINPSGVRAWQVVSDTTVGDPGAGHPLTHSVAHFTLDGYSQERSDVPEGRTPILVSGVFEGSMRGIDDVGTRINHQKELPGQSMVPDCGADFTWEA